MLRSRIIQGPALVNFQIFDAFSGISLLKRTATACNCFVSWVGNTQVAMHHRLDTEPEAHLSKLGPPFQPLFFMHLEVQHGKTTAKENANILPLTLR